MADEFITDVVARKVCVARAPNCVKTDEEVAEEIMSLVREHDANKSAYELSAADIVKADIANSVKPRERMVEVTERFQRKGRSFGFMAGEPATPVVQPPRVNYISGDGVILTHSLGVVAVELEKKGMSDAAALVKFLISNDAARK